MNWYTIQGVPMYITSHAATLMINAGVKPELMKSQTALFTPKSPTFTDGQVEDWLKSEAVKAERANIKKMRPDLRCLVDMV